MKNTTNCHHCGATLEARTVEIMGKTIPFGYSDCRCGEASKAREDIAKVETKKAAEKSAEERNRRYARAGIKPRFLNAEAECGEYLNDIISGRGLYIQGSFGTGKTYLANSIAKRCCDVGMSVRVTSTLKILSTIRATFGGSAAEEDVFSSLANCQLLIIDDLGKEAPTEWVLSMLFRVIDDRSESLLPAVITTNYSKPELVERLADGNQARRDTATAIVSRLFEMCKKVELVGEDRRLRG